MSNPIQGAQSRIEDLLARNKEFTKTFQPPPQILDLLQSPKRPPGVCIISCADARVIPEQYFNFGPVEVFVIRNAGGRASDALRSLAVLDQAVKLYAVLVVHHTDCGLSHAHNADIQWALKERDPEQAAEIEGTDFGEIVGANLDESLRRDVQVVKGSKWFSDDMIVKGFLYDLKTGEVSERVG